ncbi:MAG: polysaccharide deacetylase family protein [Phenylobacterium sp.]|uniref:oligosaccharide deacetylase HfsH n=1 Tax=Phenylobacterium sp. TaxID=1871053 RepID=UPI00391B440B
MAQGYADAYQPDRSLKGKLRRRLVRLAHRRPLQAGPKMPMVSFAFDDAPLTAAQAGAAILEARGVRGCYFVSAALAGQQAPMGVCARPDDYRALAAAGHELACHTYSHLDCGRADGAAAVQDVERNAEAFRAWGLQPPTTFAYPYGDVGFGPKAALGDRFALLRALHPGVINRGTDLNQCPAVGIEGETGENVARRWLAEAKAQGAWVILFTHDVRPDPSPWGCTPDALGRLTDEALAHGFEVVTVADGARRLGL